MTLLKLTDTLRAKMRVAAGSLPVADGMVARGAIDGLSMREIADLLGVTEPVATKRVAAVMPGLASVAFPRRTEVAPHVYGELLSVSFDLERAIYSICYDHHAHMRQSAPPKFAVVTHTGATLAMSLDRPAGKWLDVTLEAQ